MFNKSLTLKCNEFPKDTIEFYRTHNDTIFVEVTDRESGELEFCSVNINPEDVYKFLSDNYDLEELKKKAETK